METALRGVGGPGAGLQDWDFMYSALNIAG